MKLLGRRRSVGLTAVVVAFAAVALISGGVFAASNLISNGSFETYLPGVFGTPGSGAIAPWTIDAGNVDVVVNGWQNADGNVSLDMNGFVPGTISQTLATVPGTEYTVTFDMAGNPGNPKGVKTMEVDAAGQSATYTFDTTGHSNSDMGWTPETFTFTATDTTTTLTFKSLTCVSSCGWWVPNAQGPALDNVSVQAATQTKADILGGSGVSGKGISSAPGLQTEFNPTSQAAAHAGKK